MHYVVSQLALRGLIALPTIRNTAGIDLLVSKSNGASHASLQVKTSQRKVSFWPMSRPERCLTGSRCFYVFVRFVESEKRFEAFLERGVSVAQQVKRNAARYKRKGRRAFPYWALPQTPREVSVLRRRWERWRPPAVRSAASR